MAKRLGLVALLVAVLVALLWSACDRGLPPDGAAPRSEATPARYPTPQRQQRGVRPRSADVSGSDTAAPTAETASDDWEVVVLGAKDAPIVGATLTVGARPVTHDAAGADGVLRERRLPGETSVAAVISGAAPTTHVVLTQPRTVVRCPDALPLVVHLIDAETGRALAGGSVILEECEVPPASDGDGFRLAASSIHRGRLVSRLLRVTPPAGYVGVRRDVWAYVSVFADAAELTVPLAPELDLTIEVRDAAGVAVAGAVASVPWIADAPRDEPRGPSDAAGRIALPGMPFVRNAPVVVDVSARGLTGRAETTLGPSPGGPLLLVARLVEDRPPLANRFGVISDPAGPDFLHEPNGDATVVVRVERPDGRIAADVPVRLAGAGDLFWRLETRTDADGRATFARIPAGACALELVAPGLTKEQRRIVVAAGETKTVVVRPPLGRAGVVVVLDETGRPLPGALVSIPDETDFVRFFDDGGVQRLEQRTDAAGRVRLLGLPEGTVRGRVEWDVRYADFEFEPGADARVTLPPRKE